MKRRRQLLASLAVAVFATSVGFVALQTPAAQAHGATMFPGSRTWFCYQDGLRSNGQIIAYNPACANAIAQSGTTPLYNWFAVLRSDAGGRTTGFIPDGQLCSGGTGGPYDFRPYNAVRTDWPMTHLTSGRTIQFRHSNWARHPGTFFLSITRQGWTPGQQLNWSDLQEFASVSNPPDNGGPGALNYYFWDAQLPSGRSGRAIIYIRWVRGDSQENFFSCSDVIFDGGNGEVTGVGPGQTQSPPGPGPSSSTSPSPNPNPGACAATFTKNSEWGGGFQGGVSVRNNGTSALNGWTVRATWPNGQTVTQVWEATHTPGTGTSTFRNVGHNGNLPANGTASFGFLGSWSGTNNAPTLTCTSP